MVSLFLRLEWLKIYRSSTFEKSVLKGIVMGIIGLLLLSYLAMVGLFLSDIIAAIAFGEDKINFVNKYLFYFFTIEFFYRYFIQKLPIMELEKFLHLPIKKSSIMHYLLIRSFVSIFSIVTFLLFLPFATTEVAASYGGQYAFYWIASIVFISWSLHYFMLWFKQRFEDSLWGLIMVLAVSLITASATYLQWFDFGAMVAPLFAYSLTSGIPVIGFLGLFIGCYYLSFRFYKNNAYAEVKNAEESSVWSNHSLGVFNRFGLAGELAEAEWKLIIRHKKSRTYLMLTLFFMLYGLMFYNNPQYRTEDGFTPFIIFPATIIMGMFMMNYGQLLISWNSANFDFFMNRPGGLSALIKGKFLLFGLATLVTFFLTVPYVYFGWHILLLHLAVGLFNIGITMHLMALIALWNPKPMDINKGAVFNYEGVGIAQFVLVIPAFLMPYLIYLPAEKLVGPVGGLLVLGLIGLCGLALMPVMTKWSIQKLYRNKYKVAAVFRSKQA